MVGRNIRQAKWDNDYSLLNANIVLASDISKVLAGKSFQPITSYLSQNPRTMKARSLEEVERTLEYWAKEE